MANPRHKDTVFRDLFGSPERRHYTLSLYNALAGTSYDDPGVIEVTTLGDVVYMNVKNDVSFIIDEEMTLWEHRSTYNPNMPVRGLVYFSRLYQKYIYQRNLNIYGSKPVKLPTPRFVVFYNGTADRRERETMRLSDLLGGDDADIEVKATMVNINAGKNQELMKACEALAGYSALVAGVRRKVGGGYNLEEAVSEAVDECIAGGILEEYLLSKKSEVIAMFMTEYDEDKVREMFKEDGRAEERSRTLASAAALVRAGELSIEAAASGFGFIEDEIRAAMQPLPEGR